MTWASYLKNHSASADYNENEKSVAMLSQVPKDAKEAIKIFENISNSPSLVVLSKNAIDGKVHTFFHLFSTGNNILKKDRKFGALMGFRKEATTILIDPISAFKYSLVKDQFHLSRLFYRFPPRRK